MTVNVYTDASHCSTTRVATCGFVVYVRGEMIKHTMMFVGNTNSVYFAEYVAVTEALCYCFLMDGVRRIIVHTDCLDAVQRSESKTNGSKHKFINDMFDTLEIIKDHSVFVKLEYVKSHAKNKRHNFIDCSTRYELRKFLKTKKDQNETTPFKERHPVTYYRSSNRL